MIALFATVVLSLTNGPLTRTTLAGNVNFDPLDLASKDLMPRTTNARRTETEVLYEYREAELRHGRLAMLAAIAYPAQEILNPLLAQQLHMPSKLAGNLSPSLVNGGLDASVLIYLLGFASGLELFKPESDVPGDYGWSSNYDTSTSEFFNLQAGEVWNSRIAMVAVLGYVVQEYVTKLPVVSV